VISGRGTPCRGSHGGGENCTRVLSTSRRVVYVRSLPFCCRPSRPRGQGSVRLIPEVFVRVSRESDPAYPDLASSTSTYRLGLVNVLRPIRRPDGEEHEKCSQLKCSSLFTWPGYQPRHAEHPIRAPVDPSSPPEKVSQPRGNFITGGDARQSSRSPADRLCVRHPTYWNLLVAVALTPSREPASLRGQIRPRLDGVPLPVHGGVPRGRAEGEGRRFGGVGHRAG